MSHRAFFLLYLFCLSGCMALVQVARATLPSSNRSHDMAKASLEQVRMAVPPKPDSQPPAGGSASGRALYDEQTCLRYQGDFKDVCFHALARQRAARDLNGALQACQVVSRDRLRFECMADVAELHVPTSLEAARKVCPTIPGRKWRDQCFFGIATALVETDSRLALRTCDDSGMWRDFCRHDVLGETSLRDLDFVLDVCSREEGDLLTRKSCWHGIGKYIGRQDLDAAFSACGRVPPGPSGIYRENCVHGVGWAAGERLGAAGARRCVAAGPLSGSCRLGVAFQLKRIDPAAAMDICLSVTRDDLRDHCQSFLSR